MTAPITITTSGRSRIPATASLYATAFRSDPVITYLLSTLSPPERHAYLEEYFTRLATAAGLNDAIFEEAEDFSSISIVLPPGKSVDNPWTLIPAGLFSVLWRLGWKGCWRMLGEFEPATSAVRRKALGASFKANFYYLFFVATREDARGRGLSSALIKSLQDRAAKENLPVWLEATTEYSSRVYAKLGFETVETVVFGKGHADADGTALEGGCGVPVYCMVWWPARDS
jgi:GNAT superfamily N-acetyltransferase